jgi:dihydroorotate dehydrogenase electron transfer subunit
MELWVRRLGAGTEELFKTLKAGTEVELTAPLGQGLSDELMNSSEPLVFLSGGVGGASILPLVRARREQGAQKDLWIHGERTLKLLDREIAQARASLRPDLFYIERSEEVKAERSEEIKAERSEKIKAERSEEIPIQEGRITRVFESRPSKLAWPELVGAYVACGPSAMLEALLKLASSSKFGLDKLYLGLEEKMGCGIGLCFSCSVLKTHEGPQRCCIEGPWFRASEIEAHFDFRRGQASRGQVNKGQVKTGARS